MCEGLEVCHVMELQQVDVVRTQGQWDCELQRELTMSALL